ncbi:MAG: hypothetical protein M8357_00920 [Desulfobulbaceae bacterium]|nr:hypothetical protein [Desulfobulbaceae bacterium]
MTTYKELEQKIDNTVVLSSVCRGEWCRLLEPEMDKLDYEFHDYLKSGEVNEPFCLVAISKRMRQGYRNLSSDILV